MRIYILLFLPCILAGSFFPLELSTVDNDSTPETIALYRNLHNIAYNYRGFIFGQEFANTYSVSSYKSEGHQGLNTNKWKTDVNDVLWNQVNNHPGLIAYDMLYILDKGNNCFNGICEPQIHLQGLKAAYSKSFSQGGAGAVIAMEWHIIGWDASQGFAPTGGNEWLAWNIVYDKGGARQWFYGQLDRAIKVLNEDLYDENGRKIPIILRLFHEMNGDWFWWCNGDINKTHITHDDYKQLYRLAVDYIKPRVNNVLFVWSPDKWVALPDYDADHNYPGDEYVDIIGVDAYEVGDSYYTIDNFRSQVGKMVDFSRNHGKIAVASEVGYRAGVGQRRDREWASGNFWYEVILPALRDDPTGRCQNIAYLMSWMNCGWEFESNNAYVPHAGSSESAKDAFRKFRDDPFVMFSSDLPSMFSLYEPVIAKLLKGLIKLISS
jgi:mannan endo-1,4-beta-mannosidase